MLLDETLQFPDFKKEDSKFISASKVEEFLKDEAQGFAMFVSLKFKCKETMVDLPVVCEFSYVFPDDITDLLQERDLSYI